MANSDLVRASRDGDQFHYLWAARRCLSLLDSQSGLVAVSIEGASPTESSSDGRLEAGEELIDVGEYYGSEDISLADRVEYFQVKHSTYRQSEAWTPSGVENTLRGFSVRYRELVTKFEKAEILRKIRFRFFTNRPISVRLCEAVDDAANARAPRHVSITEKLKEFTSLDGQELSEFCSLLRLEGNEDGYWEQRNILFQSVSGYLSDLDLDAPVQLKELITRKALSESTKDPTITRLDVLRSLKVDEDDLFPAPCLLQSEPDAVAREQEQEFASAITDGSHHPIIVHAAGGVGKSVFATRIGMGLPEGSFCVLYDCYGNGEYRSASGFRHRHKDVIPQVANELASRGLCHPLIPTTTADPSAYLRAFLHRLQQSVTKLQAKNPRAILCIVVDAADNAQIAAEDEGERRSFVRDLLREKLPEGVRLVALCRSHRRDKLEPPPNVQYLELRPFSRAETATFLRCFYPDANEYDVDEFHRLSSQNPRVQGLAMAWGGPLTDVLRKLGPNPTTVEDTIGTLLDEAITSLRDAAGSIEGDQIDRVCTGLAVLRPLIPISVLASMSGVPESAIRSFAFDLGRPLVVTDGTIQFFDEPAETWFRERFKPRSSDLATFVESLRPHASDSSYVASVLPQLMLEAGQYTELVGLALSSDGLPEDSALERRDVELQRLQFALKASLRSKHYLDAAKLSMKAAGETAGDDRQQTLLQENTDLAAVFLEPNSIQQVVSRRLLGTGWTGSHHAYEAGLMSGNADLSGDARSRLRMAYQWLQNWSRLSEEERGYEEVSSEDIAEVAIAELNIHDAARAAHSIRRWRPRSLSFEAGAILAKRLVDHARYKELDELSFAARNNVFLLLAITQEMRSVHRNPPKEVIERTLRLALDRRIRLAEPSAWGNDETVLHAVVALVEAAFATGVSSAKDLISVLDKHLPPEPRKGLASPHGHGRLGLVRAYTLRAALSNQPIELADLAHPDLKERLQKDPNGQSSQEVREFREDVGSLLPWSQLWAEATLGRVPVDELVGAIERIRAEAGQGNTSRFRNKPHTANEIARVWFDMLGTTGVTTSEAFTAFDQWATSLERPLSTTTLTQVARQMTRAAGLEDEALKYASDAFERVKRERDHADAIGGAYICLSRAVLPLSRAEAESYFDAAVEVASKIGDEVIDRWAAMLDLADRSATPKGNQPELAYRFARCSELIYAYMARDKYFDWEATVAAIAGLCPSSVMAIVSRWRDRDFGWPARILPIAIHSLEERGDLHPQTALGLLPFRADWDRSVRLDTALAMCSVSTEKQAVLDFFGHYATLEELDSREWRSIKNVCESHGLGFPDIDNFIRIAERREQSRCSTASDDRRSLPKTSNAESSREWDDIFSGVDLTAAADIALSYDRYRSCGAPYYRDAYFREVCRRIPVGQESSFIEAVGGVTSFDLYDYRSVFEQLPDSWKRRVSTRPALACLVRTLFSRFCMEVTKSRYGQRFPFELACKVSGLTESEIIETVLSAFGEATEIVGASRLFTLVGLLAPKLTDAEACDALSFSLDLLGGSLEESDGDGPWSEMLVPPRNLEEAIAGYLWAALAAPQASLRWEAAHSVRGMCALGRADVLSQLMRMLENGGGGAFVDARSHFYELHARQWLLIALARASKETPALIAPHGEFLSQIALTGPEHILIRQFAARAVQTLIDSGQLEASADERQQLIGVNQPSLPVVQAKFHEQMHGSPANSYDGTDDDRWFFGIDMGPYWFEPLGRCFGVSQGEIERRAREVIRANWGFSGSGRWDDDQRARRGVFKDMETHHSHGSYPRSDDLRFYLSYHAMMVVAGHLLATFPLHEDPEYPWDDFEDWLSGHDLSRNDGDWLADRRDSPPLEWPHWKDATSPDGWRWSLSSDDFDEVLFSSDGKVAVWGHWTALSGQRREAVQIRSALVSADCSQALLRALQTATSPHDYCIPDAGSRGEIDRGEFRLRGWVLQEANEIGIDRLDPWAGDIQFPPIRPAQFVEESMGLSSDPEWRVWSAAIEDRCEPVLWSRVWGGFRDRDDDDEYEGGERLEASISFIQRFLRDLETDLLVEVQVGRRPRCSRYSRSEEGGLEYVPPSAKLFLIRGDGSVLTI
ncbi:AVAST type 3 anti-phage nuclease/ATPase Avs3a [Thioalkalivibrio sp. ALM2T]|uniref:AVAST type 3 anti-phage nuclease/ATPase Avs3a n=1 Tax=Thioalkalivibrio sp. ALM2T TaxID=1158184 RepID=UPI0003A0A0D1|nr:AVAST type 3 anti-phage nuclease/ATPase Avs3a [Thioalkalivibrio sp. ALM2T]